MQKFVFKQLDEVVKNINDSGKKLIYLAGASASGKTYIAEEIAKKLEQQGKKVLTISSDNYYHSDSGVKMLIYGTYDHPALIDYPLLSQNIAQYMQKGEFDLPLYSFAESRRTGYTTVAQHADVVIVEGLYTISQLPTTYNPLRIYINAGEEDLIVRRLLRDPARVGEPLHMVVSALNNVFPMWHLYGDVQKETADIEIFNDYDLLAKDGKIMVHKLFEDNMIMGKEFVYEEGVVEYRYQDSTDDDNAHLLVREYYEGNLLKSVGIVKTRPLDDGLGRINISMRIYKPGVLTQIHNLVQNAGLTYMGYEKFTHMKYKDTDNKEIIVEQRNTEKFIKYSS